MSKPVKGLPGRRPGPAPPQLPLSPVTRSGGPDTLQFIGAWRRSTVSLSRHVSRQDRRGGFRCLGADASRPTAHHDAVSPGDRRAGLHGERGQGLLVGPRLALPGRPNPAAKSALRRSNPLAAQRRESV
jgi:hypothetical protein